MCRTFFHDDVIKWIHFPRYWPFVRGIHRSSVNSPDKGQWRGALMFSFICVWINDWLSWGWWFETPSHQLWRQCIVLCLLQIKSLVRKSNCMSIGCRHRKWLHRIDNPFIRWLTKMIAEKSLLILTYTKACIAIWEQYQAEPLHTWHSDRVKTGLRTKFQVVLISNYLRNSVTYAQVRSCLLDN